MRVLSACALTLAALLRSRVALSQDAPTASTCVPSNCVSELGTNDDGQGDANDPIGCCSYYVGENPLELNTEAMDGVYFGVEECATIQMCREQGFRVGHRFHSPDPESVPYGDDAACHVNDQYCHNYTRGEVIDSQPDVTCDCEYPISIYGRFRQADGTVVDSLYNSKSMHTSAKSTACTITSKEDGMWKTSDVDCTQQGTAYGCCEITYSNPNNVLLQSASGLNYLKETMRMCMLSEDCAKLNGDTGSALADCEVNAANCIQDLTAGVVINSTHRRCDCTKSYGAVAKFNPNTVTGCPVLNCPTPPKGCVYRETSRLDSNGCHTQCGWVDCGINLGPTGQTCTKGPCHAIKDGCTVTTSDEFDTDGCPLHACGINSCGPDCPTPSCELEKSQLQPGCKLMPDTTELDGDGCPLFPCGQEVCCQAKGVDCPPAPTDLAEGCSIVDSDIVNDEDGCLRYPCGMEKCPCYDPKNCEDWTQEQLDEFKKKGCNIEPASTEVGDDGCLVLPCINIDCPVELSGDDDILNPQPSVDAQNGSPFPAGGGTRRLLR